METVVRLSLTKDLGSGKLGSSANRGHKRVSSLTKMTLEEAELGEF
jgi:hypothetical protein